MGDVWCRCECFVGWSGDGGSEWYGDDQGNIRFAGSVGIGDGRSSACERRVVAYGA